MRRISPFTDRQLSALRSARDDLERVDLDIHGERVRFYSNIAEIPSRVREGYSYFEAPMPAEVPGSRDIYVWSLAGAHGHRLATRLFGRQKPPEFALMPVDFRHVYWIASLGSLIYLTGQFFTAIIETALRERFLAIHGAAVVRHGVGALLVGEARSGKSSLTLGLLYRGFQFASDDVVLLEKSTHRVHAFPRLINVRQESLTTVPGLSRDYAKMRVGGTFGETRWFLDRSDRAAAPFGCRYLFLLGRRGRIPRLQPVRPAEAALALIRNGVYPMNPMVDDPYARRDLEVLSAFLEPVETFELIQGPAVETLDLVAETVGAGSIAG